MQRASKWLKQASKHRQGCLPVVESSNSLLFYLREAKQTYFLYRAGRVGRHACLQVNLGSQLPPLSQSAAALEWLTAGAGGCSERASKAAEAAVDALLQVAF